MTPDHGLQQTARCACLPVFLEQSGSTAELAR